MRIISWNVNGVRACYKKGLEGFVRSEKPNILCLQETKAHPGQLDDSLLKLMEPFSAWASAQKKGYSGVVTFSTHTPVSHKIGIGIEEFDSEGRVAMTDHGEFLLYNVYFPNGQRDEVRQTYKMRFHAALAECVQGQLKSGRQVIIVGDYNVAPKEIDIFDPVRYQNTSGFLPSERKWFEEFLGLGFADSFRLLHANERERYSWWSQMDRSRLSNRGWRIDLICISKGLESKIKNAEILDHVEGSDHCPVMLDIGLDIS